MTTAVPPMLTDDQIVADVLEIVGDATMTEHYVDARAKEWSYKRRIDPGDVKGALYRMRQAIAAARRANFRHSKSAKRAIKQFIAAVRKANRPRGGLGEELRLSLGLDRLLLYLEAHEEVRREPKPDAVEKRIAAHVALGLCECFGVPVATSREGKFCLVAAALYGDPFADLQYHCANVLAKNRDKHRPRT